MVHTRIKPRSPSTRSAAVLSGVNPVSASTVLAWERKASLIVTAISVKARTVEEFLLWFVKDFSRYPEEHFQAAVLEQGNYSVHSHSGIRVRIDFVWNPPKHSFLQNCMRRNKSSYSFLFLESQAERFHSAKTSIISSWLDFLLSVLLHSYYGFSPEKLMALFTKMQTFFEKAVVLKQILPLPSK